MLPIIGPIVDLIDKFVPDRDAREKARAEIARMEASGELQVMLAQIGVNAAEAGHRSVFVSGWRPFVGWVCAVALLHHVMIADFITAWWPAYAPTTDDTLWHVLTGMLGLGGLRSYEKMRGVARSR